MQKTFISYSRFQELKALLLSDNFNFTNFKSDERFFFNKSYNILNELNTYYFESQLRFDKRSNNRVNILREIYVNKITNITVEMIFNLSSEFHTKGVDYNRIRKAFLANPNLPLFLITVNCGNKESFDYLFNNIKRIIFLVFSSTSPKNIIKYIESTNTKDEITKQANQFILSFLNNNCI